MAHGKIWRTSKYWSPTNAAVNEAPALFNVKAGWRVRWATARITTGWAAATNATVVLGDGGAANGFINTFANLQATGITDGVGPSLLTAGGKLYTVNDTVDVTYVANNATSASNAATIRFTLGLEESEGT